MSSKIDKIISSIPDGLSEIEIIRYIYLKCGELFTYNRDFCYASEEKVIELYDEIFYWFGISDGEKARLKKTCNQIATACTEGINIAMKKQKKSKCVWAENIGYVPSEEAHVATLVYIGEKVYFLDLYKDLYRIQKGMRTCYFAPSKEKLEKEKSLHFSIKEKLNGIECTTIPDEELMQMDKKCGYNRNGIYMDDALIQLKTEMEKINSIEDAKEYIGNLECKDRNDFSLNFKLEFIRKYLINSNQEKKLDISELTKFYIKVYYTLLSDKEIKECKLSHLDIHFKGQPSVLFNIKTPRELIYYIYKGKNEGFERITEEEIGEFKKDGDIRDDSIVIIR